MDKAPDWRSGRCRFESCLNWCRFKSCHGQHFYHRRAWMGNALTPHRHLGGFIQANLLDQSVRSVTLVSRSGQTIYWKKLLNVWNNYYFRHLIIIIIYDVISKYVIRYRSIFINIQHHKNWPWQDLNLHPQIRKLVLYHFSYMVLAYMLIALNTNV